MTLHLTEARAIVDAAIVRARALKAEISVAVCSRDGRLIALNMMDGAVAMANQGSIGKAIAAATWGRSSGDPKGPLDELMSVAAVGLGATAIPMAGGLPIIRNGVIEGACGVAGRGDTDQDEDCARAGLMAIGAGVAA